MKNHLIWIISDKNQHLEPLLIAPNPPQDSNIMIKNIGIVGYFIIISILLYISYIKNYFNINSKHILSTVLFSISISCLVFFILYHFHFSSRDIFFNKYTNNLYVRTRSTGWRATTNDDSRKGPADFSRYVITGNQKKFFKTKEEEELMTYAIEQEKFQDMLKQGEFKAVDWNTWRKKLYKGHVKEGRFEASNHMTKIWNAAMESAYNSLTILLTVGFIITSYSQKVFYDIKLWLLVSLAIALVSLTTWFPYKNYDERNTWLYFIKQYNIMNLMIALTAVILLLGLTGK